MDTCSFISFDNTENAFAYKTTQELKKAGLLFSILRYPFIVRWGIQITPWALKQHLPVKWLIRNTLFTQFVGGETLAETAGVVKKLGTHKVYVILDYGVEGGEKDEAGFEHAMEKFIEVIRYASAQPNIPFISVKVTGIARLNLLAKLDAAVSDLQGSLMKRYAAALALLNEAERGEWEQVQRRMEKICTVASELDVGVLIDAEETWIQDPVDAMTILMMEKFNKRRAIVYNTVQLYRHDRLDFLKDSQEAAQLRNFILGVKLVRGAYMEKERERAAQMGYSSPIQPDKVATDKDFDKAILYCFDNINRISVIIASHNEASNLYAIRLMQEMHIPRDHSHVHFSQLYGMSDHITFNLARAGCTVSKYLPFGPINDVVPYLMRRAQENSSIAGQTGRELSLIKQELKRRSL